MRRFSKAGRGIALTANQIGIPLQACAILSSSGRVILACNPTIEIDEWAFRREGCLSLPGLFMPLRVVESATVKYLDITGKAVTTAVEGLEAQAWNHEVEHLHGRTILDRCTNKIMRADALRAWKRATARGQV